MGLKADLTAEVKKIFGDPWTKRAGTKVPNTEDIQLGNQGVELDATVLYADLADSTDLVDAYPAEFAAEVYKTYLICAVRVINANGGVVTAFDGDRVMAVYIGPTKTVRAAKTAMQINYAVKQIINPKLREQYPNSTYVVKQVVGIDKSTLLVARTGIRGTNDLVWVGSSANYAAKLSAYSSQTYSTYITDRAYKELDSSTQFSSGINMWAGVAPMKSERVYGTTYWWTID